MLSRRRLWFVPAILTVFSLYILFRTYNSGAAPLPYPANGDDGRLHWSKRPEQHRVSKYILPPRGAAKKVPRIQYEFERHPETPEEKQVREMRRDAVKESFVHSWEGYKKHAFGKDEVVPLSGGGRSSFGGWGATMVDAMDTLWIMGLKKDFELCVAAVAEIDFTTNTENTLNVFETTIRYMGGLLAAYDLSDRRDRILLRKAQELGEVLYTAFDTPNRMPVTRWQWRKSALGGTIEASNSTLLAEIGSLGLEFTRLTQLTGDRRYYDAIARIADEMEASQNHTLIPGLWPTIINAQDFGVEYNHFTLGGMADSTYEYLIKMHIILGARTLQYQRMYEKAINAAKQQLFFKPLTPTNEDILFSGNAGYNSKKEIVLEPQGQHLTCFVAGMVGMSAKMLARTDELNVARRLLDGCIWAYNAMPSGLMPESFHLIPCSFGAGRADPNDCKWSTDRWYEGIASLVGEDEATKEMTALQRGKHWAEKQGLLPGFAAMGDNRYILRPEAIESMFIMYRITGDPALQDAAWKMFQSIERATRTDIAHAAVYDVRVKMPEKSDRMESFWLAETLKYFYLIFSEPSLINLDQYVFNTEAHPFKRPTGIPTYFGAGG